MRRIASLLAIGVPLILAAPAVAQPRPGGGGPAARVPPGVTAHRDLAYVVDGHERQKLDLFVPENKDQAVRASPVTYVSRDDPSFLIVHGDEDPVVPINQSQLLHDALERAGVTSHFHTIRGAGHGQGFGGPEIESMVGDFFDRVLEARPPPPNLGPVREARRETALSTAMPRPSKQR